MRIADEFPMDRLIGGKARIEDMSAEIEEHIEDLVPFAIRAGPRILEGHENDPRAQIASASFLTGFFVGWEMRGLRP